MFRRDEPTIDEIMLDPTVRALMRADRVDAAAFEAKLRGLARGLRQGRRERQAADDTEGSKRLLPLVSGLMPAGTPRHCWC